MKMRSGKGVWIASRFALVMVASIGLQLAALAADSYLNSITFDNKSGETALVKTIGPTPRIIEIPDRETGTVNVGAGDYYILVRYGAGPPFTYTKGDPFTVTETSTEFSRIAITLHKVPDGNYQTYGSSQREFDAVPIGEVAGSDVSGRNAHRRIGDTDTIMISDPSVYDRHCILDKPCQIIVKGVTAEGNDIYLPEACTTRGSQTLVRCVGVEFQFATLEIPLRLGPYTFTPNKSDASIKITPSGLLLRNVDLKNAPGDSKADSVNACDQITSSRPPWFDKAGGLVEVGKKKISDFPSTALGYEIGKLIAFQPEFSLPLNGTDGSDTKVTVKVRDSGLTQIYNPALKALLISFFVMEPGEVNLVATVRDHYECPFVDATTPPEDYSRYLTVVELRSAVMARSTFLGKDYSVHRINLSGTDVGAGNKRIATYALMQIPQERNVMPIGLLPGTRIVVPKDVVFVVTGKSGGQEVRYRISGGAIDVRFDKKVRIENGTRF
jgi:hypothetical protein